jgi:hypothetical protein
MCLGPRYLDCGGRHEALARLSLAVVTAVTAAVWAAAAGAGGSSAFTGTVHVVEHAATDAVTNGSKDDALGNVLTFARLRRALTIVAGLEAGRACPTHRALTATE